MRNFGYIILIMSVLSACKSSFEQVRVSNDPTRILAESMKYYEKKDYLRAQTLMELILNQYRGTREGEELYFSYAYTHYHLGSYALSASYFTNFTTTFAYSTFAEEANYMIAQSYYKQSPIFRLDQQTSIDAINAYQDFANKYPDSDKVHECNERIDELRSKLEEKAYHQGLLYYHLGKYNAAITSFDNMLSEYPESVNAEHARFLILKSSVEYAVNSIYIKRAERLEAAKLRYKEYINRYPRGHNAKEAKELNKQIELEFKNLS